MKRPTPHTPVTGSVLVIFLFASMVVFGLVASVVIVSTAHSRALGEMMSETTALYLAEAGLAAAQEEFIRKIDSSGDGLGNASADEETGSYDVTATPLGDDRYQITSTATVEGGPPLTLEQIVHIAPGSRFPNGAMSIVGNFKKEIVDFRMHVGLVLDGGNSPAISIGDAVLFDEVSQDFAKAMQDGDLPMSSVSGEQTSFIDTPQGTFEIAMAQGDTGSLDIDDLKVVYDQLKTQVDSILPVATAVNGVIVSGTQVQTYGTKDAPVILNFTDKVEIDNDAQVVGFGTAFLQRDLTLKENATFDWDGDVIFYSDDKIPALSVKNQGHLKVKGNLIILGEGSGDVHFNLEPDATALVDGSLLIGTPYDVTKGQKIIATLDGGMSVEGLFTLLGSKVKLTCNPTSDFFVNGMLQIGVEGPEGGDLKLDFDGDTEIHKNVLKIKKGGEALERLGAMLSITEMQDILELYITTKQWSREP